MVSLLMSKSDGLSYCVNMEGMPLHGRIGAPGMPSGGGGGSFNSNYSTFCLLFLLLQSTHCFKEEDKMNCVELIQTKFLNSL